MNTEKTIGLFGGTFNPIHNAHLRVAEEVRQILSLKKILFIPSCYPPLKKKDLVNPSDRIVMVKLAVKENPYFETSEIECISKEPSYTATTIAKLKETYPKEKLSLILGVDAFLDIPNWYMPDFIINSIDFIIISRPPELFNNSKNSPYIDISDDIIYKLEKGEIVEHKTILKSKRLLTFLKVTSIDISATMIRNLIRKGRSIKYLLPERVESFIISKGLYK